MSLPLMGWGRQFRRVGNCRAKRKRKSQCY